MRDARCKHQDYDIGRRIARRTIGASVRRHASSLTMLAGPRCARRHGAGFASLEPAQGNARQ
jgi:hypothetical protein